MPKRLEANRTIIAKLAELVELSKTWPLDAIIDLRRLSEAKTIYPH